MLYLLFASAEGYALFACAAAGTEVADSNFDSFSRHVSLNAICSYATAESALENVSAVSEGKVHAELKSFLEAHFPRGEDVVLGVGNSELGSAIRAALDRELTCQAEGSVPQLLRGVRTYLPQYLENLAETSAHRHLAQSAAATLAMSVEPPSTGAQILNAERALFRALRDADPSMASFGLTFHAPSSSGPESE